jgi:hypothetical protein
MDDRAVSPRAGMFQGLCAHHLRVVVVDVAAVAADVPQLVLPRGHAHGDAAAAPTAEVGELQRPGGGFLRLHAQGGACASASPRFGLFPLLLELTGA